MTGPLVGIRVIDAAVGWAALAGRLLADLGADVVKLEPLEGDPGRHEPPLIDGASLPFWRRNLGKKSLRVAPGDRRLAALLAGADVLIEGGPSRPFDFAPLVGGRDDLVLATLSAFGDGPRAGWRATDLIAQAAGGMLALNGEPDREPLSVAGEPSYTLASHNLVAGVLLALRTRRQTGRGQRVEVTLQEAVAAAVEPVGVLYNFDGKVARRTGDLHWVRGYGIFPCADGYVTLAWNRNFDHLVALLASDGMADDLTDERYLDPAVVDAEIDHIREVLGRWAASRTREEIFSRAQQLRLQWAPVNPPQDVLADPQLAARHFFVPLPGPRGTLPVAGAPAVLSRTPWRPRRPLENFDGLPERSPPRRTVSPPFQGGALVGVRVLDFTWVLAGPYGTRILADHGADVIKVQTDRKLVGYVGDGYFATWNRNKRGITLDLDHREARALVHRLVAVSDVVADSFSARVMRQWGLDDQALFALRPDLVIAHLSGMGHSGPYEHYVSYGPTAQALCGMSYLTAYAPGERPLGLGFSLSDHIAGLVLANAVLAALDHRNRTGEGQVIDVSQFEASATFMEEALLEAATGLPVEARGNTGSPGSIGPVGVFRCRGDDRWLAVEVESEEQRAALIRVIGTAASLHDRLTTWARQQDASEAMRMLQAQGVPASVVATAVDLVERDEGLQARGFWWESEHPTLGRRRTDGSPIHLDRTPPPPPSPSPQLGQHNDEVFGELLGLSAREIARLTAAGAIR